MDNDKEIDDILSASEIARQPAQLPDEELPIPEVISEDFFTKASLSPNEASSDPKNHISYSISAKDASPSFIQAPLPSDSTWECKHCQKRAERVCPNCQGTYCLNCASFIDHSYCKMCLSEGTIEIKTEELIDKDGVHHKGRRLVPISEAYQTLPKMVCEMNDFELAAHISKHKMLAHKHGLAKTFCEINVTLGEFEQKGREHITRKKRSLASATIQTPSGKAVVASFAASQSKAKESRAGNGNSGINIPTKIETKAQATNIAEILKKSGISLAQLEELVALKKKLENK